MAVLVARVDARLVRDWERYEATMEQALSAMYPNHEVLVIPASEPKWDTPAKSVREIPNQGTDMGPAMNILEIALTPRHEIIKPRKMDINRSYIKREPRFIIDDSMHDDPPRYIPDDDEVRVSRDPFMKMVFK